MTVKLRRRLDEVVRAGHPWIYRDALERMNEEPGTVVTVLNQQRRFLARGLADAGPIGVRVFLTDDAPLDERLLAERVDGAFRLRRELIAEDTTAYRLVHGEGDRLPGFVCDRYGGYATVQLDGRAAEAWRDRFVDILVPALQALGVHTVLVRTGTKDARRVDVVVGETPPAAVEVREHGMRLGVDLLRGQKTGLFLDHRESRRCVRQLAHDRSVLNLYGYTGAFSIAAGLGGTRHVTTVDTAEGAIESASANWALNGLLSDRHRGVVADAREFLEQSSEHFELVIADPPSFAPNEKSVPRALDAYRALHRACLARVTPRGLYLAASCSSHVRADAFEATLVDAARGTASLQILGRWGAPLDHPRLPAFPEGDYLKVILLRVVPRGRPRQRAPR